ncbi:hypothetical protein [Aquisalimonas sp.]|uniref:hypothetical protein n=1 Tax=Aquisalimonas sp. TaxID=1872621 RepID=UPI0025C5E6B2|nr:hypothetical protein [Aquisalimonas sp.]
MTGAVVYKPLAMVVPGERLAKDLFDEQGSLLMNAGVALDERTCRRLQQVCGVKCVPVEAVDAAVRLQARRAAVDRSLEHLFRHWRYSQAMNHLRALLANHRREMARG